VLNLLKGDICTTVPLFTATTFAQSHFHFPNTSQYNCGNELTQQYTLK